MQSLDAQGIQDSLNEIFSHELFASSRQMQKFLKHIVKETIEGRAEQLNEIAIAQDVFDKGADFDPSKDSVVRVTARRVRRRLDLYYSKSTGHSEIRITIPKGSYQSVFESIPEEKFLYKSRTPFIWATIASMAVICFGCLWFYMVGFNNNISQDTHRNQVAGDTYPLIAVTPFTNKTGEDRLDFLSSAIQLEIVKDLSRYKLVRPVVHSDTAEASLANSSGDLDYLISGTVLSVKPELDLIVKLINLKDGSLVYDRRIKRTTNTDEYSNAIAKVIEEIGGDFGGVHNVISQKRLKLIQDKIRTGKMNSMDIEVLECVSLADGVRDFPSPETFRTAYLCLQNHLKNDPNNSTLLSSMGALKYSGAASHESVFQARSVDPNINMQDGIDMINRSLELDPYNGFTLSLLSEIYEFNDNGTEALNYAELAYIEYPGDPDTIIQLSRVLAAKGEWTRALKLADDALARSSKTKPFYYHVYFIHALMNDNQEDMQRYANSLSDINHFYADIFLFLSATVSEDKETIDELRPGILNYISRNTDKDRMLNWTALFGTDEMRSKVKDVFMSGGVYNETDIATAPQQEFQAQNSKKQPR